METRSFKIELPPLPKNMAVPIEIFQECMSYQQFVGIPIFVDAEDVKRAKQLVCITIGLNYKIWEGLMEISSS